MRTNTEGRSGARGTKGEALGGLDRLWPTFKCFLLSCWYSLVLCTSRIWTFPLIASRLVPWVGRRTYFLHVDATTTLQFALPVRHVSAERPLRCPTRSRPRWKDLDPSVARFGGHRSGLPHTQKGETENSRKEPPTSKWTLA